MRMKTAAVALVSASSMLLSGFLSSPAYAATSVQYKPTTIAMTGQAAIHASHVVAIDPWSGNVTSWVPLYYLQKELRNVGVQNAWNGNTLNISSVPQTWAIDNAGTQLKGQPPEGQMEFSVNGSTHGFMRAPKLVAKDPASGVETTYVPIYYANLFLNQRLLLNVGWNGSTWNMAPQVSDGITKTTYQSDTAAAQAVQTMLQEKTYLAFNQDQTVNLGHGITAKADAGMSHVGLQWAEGRWTVEVLWFGENKGGEQLARDVVAYLDTHMLPAPNTHGAIIIRSTDANTTDLKVQTMMAWQEGTTVNHLTTTNNPLQALQTAVDSGK